MTKFQGMWQTMVLEVETTETQHDNTELSLSEQTKQNFYKHLKDTNAYEQWRLNIHQQLEEDLQRQVKQVLDETERQERLAKLRRQYLRAGQRLSSQPTENNSRQGDQWNEIDRRNQRVLHPLNAKDSYGAQKPHSKFNYLKPKLSSNSFNLESYNSYNHRHSSQQTSEHLLENSSIYFEKHYGKQTLLTSSNNASPFLYGNNIIRTNKAAILNILEEQSTADEDSNVYVNKHGVVIGTDGPFWPRDYRILYPTPKLLSRELTPKEFYLIVSNTSLTSKSKHNNNNKVKREKQRKELRMSFM